MTAALDPVALVMWGGVSLLAGGVSLYIVDRRARADSRRIADVVQAYAPEVAAKHNLRRRPAKPRGPIGALVGMPARSFTFRLAYLGVKVDRPELYPISWWLILPVATAVVVVIVAVVVFFTGPIAWFFLPVLWLFIVRGVFNHFQARHRGVLYGQFPETLSMIVRSIRTGITVQDAIRVVAEEGLSPTSSEFARLHDDIKLGTPLIEALGRMVQRIGLIEYKFFSVALVLQSQSGGSLADILESLADVVRKRVALKQRGMALASEARLSIWVLGSLPFVTASGLMVLNPDYLNLLVTTAVGRHILATGIVLLMMGFGAMWYIIKKGLS